ncbi:isocitrate lyase/PEP mutase family protein [Oryzicola mucosus]|uniref:Isocitrate lyase/phosphoenolpyruvate mutase family protein n=1 Tax=Oryzicola mucosus TaxID=2767425 RepID=A0A8J6U433_9HYPH|nr:isocitrate lyase/phosphoenolpyruvate mutase family protein [Oryzicola mucosus]MBD0413530.1 isocitrate lyase/phosphoenolpyruvate mutase family protein [Oryzicola mucosus]
MRKSEDFRNLHNGPGAFVMPNPSDIGMARLLVSMGFKALATSSAGYAFSRALPDGGVTFEEMIRHCKEMAAAVDVPVSADLERGKGDSAESAAETIFAAEAAGLAGCSIEDYSGDPSKPIYEFSHAVERVAAAAEAARAVDGGFVFTARAENFLHGVSDFDDTVRRLQAFSAAGADVLFAPGISDPAMLTTLCTALDKPVSVIAPRDVSVDQLSAIGIRRISLGPRLTQAAFGAVERAAREILDKGTFGFMGDVMPFDRLQTLYTPAASARLEK